MRLFALLLCACSGASVAPPSAVVDAGPLDPYTLGASTSIVGESGGVTVACNRGDLLLSGECAAQGGSIRSSAAAGTNGWECIGMPLVPAKGVTVEAIIGCAKP